MAKRKRTMETEHRVAACDYRYVWGRCPEHQRAGWRNAARTHEALVRAYARERNPTRLKAACGGDENG